MAVTAIVALAFLAVAAIAFVAVMAVENRSERARVLRERLASIDQAQARQHSEELQLLRDDLLSEIPALQNLLRSSASVSRLQRRLAQAGMKARPGKFILITMLCAAASGLLALNYFRVPLFALVAMVFGALVPNLYVAWRRTRRFRKFEEKFPEAIDLLGRSTRAGHAFTTSLELIATELGDPVAGEFQKLFEEQKFGLPLRDALINLSDRLPLIDVRFFVTAVLLQRETGGNLAEILDKLSHTIRERFKILRQVRVFTAQGRLTLLILMILPPGLVVVMMLMNGDFIQPLFTDPIGHRLLLIGVVMQTIGFFLIRRIIDIKV
jgi:tight adherence protein B